MENITGTFGFEKALSLVKEGKEVARKSFADTCKMRAQYPTDTSMNTLPYLQMIKNKDEKVSVFPLDLSCESIFAEDWYLVA